MSASTSFVKLYGGILESTLWCEPDRTRLVWICMLAMADQYGRVMGSVPGLANRARVPIEDARTAIDSFLSPDPDSRTKDFEGRRIEAIDGGWRLLNHAKYRAIRAEDDRREQNRLAQQRAREKRKSEAGKVSGKRQQSQQKSAESAHTDTEAEIEKRQPGAIAPSSPAEQATLPLPGLSVVPPIPAKLPDCPHRDLIAMFIAEVPEMPRPRIESWSGKNADAMRARWKWVLTAHRDNGDRYATSSAEALAWFSRFFKVVAASDFLCGRVDGRSKFTLGWLMKKDNFDKVMEHGYPNREAA